MNATNNKPLMIVGPFRSGTNVMLETLNRNYYCTPAFNQYFWKHCLPPHSAGGIIPPEVGVVCMVRNPVEWNRSIFKFWHVRRKELTPALEISKFIREPLIVYDNSNSIYDIRYHFISPTDYWNKYYYAWTFWKKIRNQLLFVRLEDFETQTESVLKSIERKFLLQRKSSWSPDLPSVRLGPIVPETLDRLDTQLFTSDEKFIENSCLPELKNIYRY